MRQTVWVAALCGLAGSAGAEPPGRVLDLSRWKLTLPTDTRRPGHPDEIRQPALATFEKSGLFFVDGDRVVFRAPCGGVTTPGSKYPRCELRETDPAIWATHDGGTHSLVATLAITKTPLVKPQVVCAQIHDSDDDLLMVRLEGKKLIIERNETGDVVLTRDYKLSTRFDVKIEATGGRVKLWYNGMQHLDWAVSRSGCYFKAGCYTQSNPAQGDSPDAFGEVAIYSLRAEHRPQP